MLDDSKANAAGRERLSALADGELEGSEVVQVCGQWRENAASRSTWHAYHLIGDVLRSDDLANQASHDAGFLQALRLRLADEPIVLAPQPLATQLPLEGSASARAVGGAKRRWSWMAPTAVAAGFVAVAGVLTITRPGVLPDRDAATAVAQVAAPAVSPVAVARPVSQAAALPEPETFVASGQVIRDARLDRYLAAHKQFAGSSALGVPSAYLRNATAEAAGR